MALPSDIPEDIADRAAILMDELRQIADDLEYTARIIMAVEKTGGEAATFGLTLRQAQVLTFLRGHDWSSGKGPSFEEIRVGCAYSSKSAVSRILGGLERRGYVRRIRGSACSIALVERAA